MIHRQQRARAGVSVRDLFRHPLRGAMSRQTSASNATKGYKYVYLYLQAFEYTHAGKCGAVRIASHSHLFVWQGIAALDHDIMVMWS